MNRIVSKIEKLRNERNWSIYRLSQESDIPANSIQNWTYRDTTPTISLLEKICEAFGITLANFFAEGNLVDVTPDIKALYDKWCALSAESKALIIELMKNLK